MFKWLDYGINLGENEESTSGKIDAYCPKCYNLQSNKSTTLKVEIETHSWFCEHCGFAGDLYQGVQAIPNINELYSPWSLNPIFNKSQPDSILTKNLIENFKKKKISEDTLKEFKISQGKKYFPIYEQEINCLVFPYFQEHSVVNYVYQHGQFRHSEIGGVETCYNSDSIQNDELYITYDEIEVLTLFECGIKSAISIFGGIEDIEGGEESINRKLYCLQYIEEKVKNVKKIVIAMPNTETGIKYKEEILRRFGKERCWVIIPPEVSYTWNQVFVEYGKSKLLHLLEAARPIPVRGIFEIDDIEEKFDELYNKGLKRGALTGFNTLNDHYTVVPGQWTVVTGIPGHGKSNFLDALLVNLSKYENWSFAIFSPENQPLERHYANILEKYWGAPFDVDKRGRITEEQKEEGKLWLKKHFSVILPHEDDSWSIDGVLSLAKVLVYRKGIKGLVIDPWNELDHSRPGNQTETEYISSVLTKIRQFARNYQVHVWLVAHPAKLYKDKDGKYPVPTPYDISGSAHYRNKADNAITVWRNVGHDDQAVTDIHVQKIRFKEVGRVGLVSLRYEPISGAFIDDIDQDKRRKALEDGEVIQTDRLIRRY